jgi:hypothetical protein
MGPDNNPGDILPIGVGLDKIGTNKLLGQQC